MADDLELCNMALAMVGQEPVPSLAGDSRVVTLLNRFFQPAKHEVLTAHPWNFALKRAALNLGGISAATVVANGTGGTPGAAALFGTTGTESTLFGGGVFQITGTITAGGILTGALVVIVAGSYDVLPDDLSSEPITGANLVGATVSVTTVAEQPGWEWDFAYALPEDCLRVWKVDTSDVVRTEPWKVEGGRILTNIAAPIDILYIARQAELPPAFSIIAATRLAMELARPIAQSETMVDALGKKYQALLRQGRQIDAQEGVPDPRRTDWLIDAMRSA